MIPFKIFDYRSFIEGLKGEPAREIINGYSEVKRELWGGENWEDGYFVWDRMRLKVTKEVLKKHTEYHMKEEKRVHEQLKLFEQLSLKKSHLLRRG